MDIEELSELTFENLLSVLDDYGQEVKKLYQTKLQEDKKIASGNLINNIQVKVAFGNLKYDVILELEDYWKFVEKGRKAGGKFPPQKAILDWIRVKPVVPYPDSNGKLPTEKQLCFLIQRKIARDGIPATNGLRTSIEAVNDYYLPKLEEALQRDFAVYSIKILGEVNKLLKI